MVSWEVDKPFMLSSKRQRLRQSQIFSAWLTTEVTINTHNKVYPSFGSREYVEARGKAMKELPKSSEILFSSPTALKLLGENTGKQIKPKAFKAIFWYEQKPND